MKFDFEDEFVDELADFEDFSDDDPDVLRAELTAVLQKNSMHRIAVYQERDGPVAAICRVDPRENNPAVQLYDDPTAALEWFTKSLRTSRKNGWTIVYDGLPLHG
jgi:hypothetical protein